MDFEGKLDYAGTLSAVLLRGDGSHRDIGVISEGTKFRLIGRPIQWWRALWNTLQRHGVIASTMGFSAFLAAYGVVEHPELMVKLLNDPRVLSLVLPAGLVTQAGANYLAADMAGGSSDISSMNYHDSGTGTVAATSTDSGLGTQAGPTTRATGTQSNPATNQYKSIGTISYTTSLAITEWGLFSQAAQGGTMWDRRVFSAVNVVNGDSIQFSYTLTMTGGGT